MKVGVKERKKRNKEDCGTSVESWQKMNYTAVCMENIPHPMPPPPPPTQQKSRSYIPSELLKKGVMVVSYIHVFRSLSSVLDAAKRHYSTYSPVVIVSNQENARFQLPEGQRTRQTQRRRAVNDLLWPKAGFQHTLSETWSQQNKKKDGLFSRVHQQHDFQVIV